MKLPFHLTEQAFKLSASFLIFALMVITFVDVIGRQFGAPLSAAFEFTELAVGVMFYVGLPYVTFRREHVMVDLVPINENSGLGRVVSIAVDILCTLLLAVATLQLWGQADTLGMFSTTTMFLKVPLEPVVRLMAVLAGFTCFLCCLLVLERARALVSPKGEGAS